MSKAKYEVIDVGACDWRRDASHFLDLVAFMGSIVRINVLGMQFSGKGPEEPLAVLCPAARYRELVALEEAVKKAPWLGGKGIITCAEEEVAQGDASSARDVADEGR